MSNAIEVVAGVRREAHCGCEFCVELKDLVAKRTGFWIYISDENNSMSLEEFYFIAQSVHSYVNLKQSENLKNRPDAN